MSSPYQETDPFIQLKGAPALITFIADRLLETPDFISSYEEAEDRRKSILKEVKDSGLLDRFLPFQKGVLFSLAYSRAEDLEDEIMQIRSL